MCMIIMFILRIFLAFFVLGALMMSSVYGSAGLMKPIPREGETCDPTHAKGCNIRIPCLPRSTESVNYINVKEPYSIAIYQLNPRTTSNSTNTYTLQFFKDTSSTGIQMVTFNQNEMNSTKSSYEIKLEPIINMVSMKNDTETYDQLVKTGKLNGYFSLSFDARSGGNEDFTFYSCADVLLTTEKRVLKGTNIVVDGSVTITEGATDTSLGDAKVGHGQSISIPGLVESTAPGADVHEGEMGNVEQNPESHVTKSASAQLGATAFYVLTTVTTSLYLLSTYFINKKEKQA
ncbi:hypothetical protein DFA_08100 [Cavenderia fasciculata]|uniref:Uncharacterized protein n=1 Tax=Cavenderia fasciculata TaxID=261658 RepID=F4Q559_CACFS|nr:uncharacterized protein DFA_08100 [Cavenderia fasciculata]EGG17118.1 hypothetical protein DFA_08100 [Cavenderia fasciculata]|eukprot:XP_004355602.1 hypothetical protein DFA_08100 [Cavenderia fasciculata]